MRCDSIILINQKIFLNGLEADVITAGPLDPKTNTYDLIVKIKASKEAVDEAIKNVLE